MRLCHATAGYYIQANARSAKLAAHRREQRQPVDNEYVTNKLKWELPNSTETTALYIYIFNIGYRTETEILQKILSHSANFFSNLLARSDQRVLGSLTSKYCRQLLMMSMLLVLNNFIKKRTLTKSTDERSDFSNGQASKPYRRTGIHLGLLFKSHMCLVGR